MKDNVRFSQLFLQVHLKGQNYLCFGNKNFCTFLEDVDRATL
jgi:hypothetical protein